MRRIKILCFLLCGLLLTGCAAGKSGTGTSDWIPQESVIPSSSSAKEEKAISIAEARQKGKSEVRYSLTESIRTDERLFYSLRELKQVLGGQPESETFNLHMNTFYIDSNGLLCIGIDADFNFAENQCVLKKEYYLTDKSVFTEEENFAMEGKWKKENDTFYLDISFLAELFSWDYDINDNDEVVIRDQNITFEQYSSVVYEPLVVQVVAGKCWSIAGRLTEAVFAGEDYRNRFSCTTPESYVKVMEGEQLRFNFYCSWIPEVASILFLNDNDKVIQVYAYTSSNTFTDYVITVPSGATKMHLTFFNNQKYQIDRVRYVKGADLEQVDSEWYARQCEERLRENQKVSWSNLSDKALDKAYVTFVLDDCRSDMDLVADLFEEYEIPLCISAIHDHFYNPSSQGKESRLEVCQRVVKNGGEILAHNGQVLTQELLEDFQTKYEHFYKDKKYLEAFGFDVQGIILAGGTGQVVGSMESDAWVRMYFNYSDLYGVEERGEPYYHSRIWLNNCRDNYQEIIQEAVENKQWISFYFHEFGEVDEEKMREILEYISRLSQGEMEVTTYKTIYEKFYQ